MKQAVDTLTAGLTAPPLFTLPFLSPTLAPAVQAALVAVACFGLCDIIKHVAKETQAPVFLPVTQSVARRVTYHTFSHVLNLDVSFHLEKRTGRLSRILERGEHGLFTAKCCLYQRMPPLLPAWLCLGFLMPCCRYSWLPVCRSAGPRAIQQIYRAVIFIFLPTIMELVAVTTVLVKTFSPLVGGLVGATFLLYSIWSIILTQVEQAHGTDSSWCSLLATASHKFAAV